MRKIVSKMKFQIFMDTENSYFLIQSILCIVNVPCVAQDIKIFSHQKAENEAVKSVAWNALDCFIAYWMSLRR